MDVQIATYNEGQLLKKNLYTYDEHELSGWATTSDAEQFRYVDGDDVDNVIRENPNRDNIDLYGVWALVGGSEAEGGG